MMGLRAILYTKVKARKYTDRGKQTRKKKKKREREREKEKRTKNENLDHHGGGYNRRITKPCKKYLRAI